MWFQKEMPHRLIKPSWDHALTEKYPEARQFRKIERQIHCACLNIMWHLISFDCSFSREKDFLPEQLRIAWKDGWVRDFFEYSMHSETDKQSKVKDILTFDGNFTISNEDNDALVRVKILRLDIRRNMLEYFSLWKIIGKFFFRAFHQLPCWTDLNCHTTTMVITNAARNRIETNVGVSIRIL